MYSWASHARAHLASYFDDATGLLFFPLPLKKKREGGPGALHVRISQGESDSRALLCGGAPRCTVEKPAHRYEFRVPLTAAFNFHGIDKSVELQIQIPGTCCGGYAPRNSFRAVIHL